MGTCDLNFLGWYNTELWDFEVIVGFGRVFGVRLWVCIVNVLVFVILDFVL